MWNERVAKSVRSRVGSSGVLSRVRCHVKCENDTSKRGGMSCATIYNKCKSSLSYTILISSSARDYTVHFDIGIHPGVFLTTCAFGRNTFFKNTFLLARR